MPNKINYAKNGRTLIHKHPVESKHAHQQVRKNTGIINLF